MSRSRDERQGQPAARRQSAYSEWYGDGSDRRGWVPIADTNPITGQLEWKDDWRQRATGWRPLDEFLMRRGR